MRACYGDWKRINVTNSNQLIRESFSSHFEHLDKPEIKFESQNLLHKFQSNQPVQHLLLHPRVWLNSSFHNILWLVQLIFWTWQFYNSNNSIFTNNRVFREIDLFFRVSSLSSARPLSRPRSIHRSMLVFEYWITPY